MSIVMIGGGIDISVGSVTGLVTMSCAVMLETSRRQPWARTILLALAIGLAFGLLQGFLIAYLDIQPFIITLAGLFLGAGLLTTIHKDPAQHHLAQRSSLSATLKWSSHGSAPRIASGISSPSR
jgi:ribose/xylose/arabinose/galactoside ABC-type transport system permease subunit